MLRHCERHWFSGDQLYRKSARCPKRPLAQIAQCDASPGNPITWFLSSSCLFASRSMQFSVRSLFSSGWHCASADMTFADSVGTDCAPPLLSTSFGCATDGRPRADGPVAGAAAAVVVTTALRRSSDLSRRMSASFCALNASV